MQMVKYAVKIKAIPDAEPFELVLESEAECNAPPKIITPKQLDSYLRNAPEQVMPYIILGSYAGLRPEEVQRLTWEDYLKDENYMLINTEVAKIKRFRKFPKKECFKQWMDDLANKTKDKKGKIATIRNVTKNTYVRDLKEKFGGPLKADAQGRDLFRHCYASYRCAETDWDFRLVADETGHSVKILKESYLKIVSKNDSTAWFSTFPDKVHK